MTYFSTGRFESFHETFPVRGIVLTILWPAHVIVMFPSTPFSTITSIFSSCPIIMSFALIVNVVEAFKTLNEVV